MPVRPLLFTIVYQHRPFSDDSELYLRRFLRSRIGLERLFRLEVEKHLVRQTVRKNTDRRVEFLDCLVIPLPGNIDPVFRSFELILEIPEVLV